eukprot:12037864-Alexandrium_andersonii.AAC.1
MSRAPGCRTLLLRTRRGGRTCPELCLHGLWLAAVRGGRAAATCLGRAGLATQAWHLPGGEVLA